MLPEQSCYIGLMSGTSLDAIDAVLVVFDNASPRIIETHQHAIPDDLRNKITALCTPGDNEIERMGKCDGWIAKLFSEATNKLLQKAGISYQQIKAIGSHGQTIRHRPSQDIPFTLQIGDPNIIAQQTHILTIADLRRSDMAAGGQAAPLVPAFHAQVFSQSDTARAILNIGGIANLTLLPSKNNTQVSGFDTGPGNVLVDTWVQKHLGCSFDEDGKWAASGSLLPKLLSEFLQDPYFDMPPPKSTGREHFNNEWLSNRLGEQDLTNPEDIANTLAELTAQSICNALNRYFPNCEELFVCGGGANNAFLMGRLNELSVCRVETTEALGIHPNWVEAVAFAWLAKQRLENKPGNLPSVTGAQRPCVLGGIYHP